jgi:RNA polymerase sigma factor (sigma-70 family)
MPHGSLPQLVRHLRRATAPGPADGDLLARFARQRDAAAFAELVRRHGPMVHGTCRRLLRDSHAAEDAWQATFLALALRAGSVRRPEALAGWLYRVACRVCLAARRAPDPGEALPDPAMLPGPDDPAAEAARRELAALAAAEVERLPEPFRSAFVLCEAAGHSNAEAARLLGCAVGTVESRLTRARQRLRRALARRGVTPEALAGIGPVAVSPELARRTAVAAAQVAAGQAATAGLVAAPVAALAEGVVKSMSAFRFKTVATALAVVVTGASWCLLALAQPPGPPFLSAPSVAARPVPAVADGVEEVFAKGELLAVTDQAVRLLPEHNWKTVVDRSSLDTDQPRVSYTNETTMMQVELPAGVAFTLDGKSCRRSDLIRGMPVEVWVRKTEKGRQVIRVAARYREPVFEIAEPMDGWGVALTLKVPGTKGPIIRLPTSDKVRVATPEKLIGVEQLKPGMRVRLTMSPDQREVQGIDVVKDE